MRTALRALRQASGYWNYPRHVLQSSGTFYRTRGVATATILGDQRWFSSSRCRHNDAAQTVLHQPALAEKSPEYIRAQARKLPLSCPGCGAPSQTIASSEAGYYTLTRSGVKSHLHDGTGEEDSTFDAILKLADKGTLQELGVKKDALPEKRASGAPICDRCHNLIHHHTGVPIFHPSIQSIQDIIEESPYKENHIYHVLDAADFPMSLIPNLQHNLSLPRLRTQNRRSKSQRFIRGRVAEVSFIITRSDLLAPKKEQVDGLMPYIRETLRDALGRSGKNVRMGNVRCVSAKRGWWTKEVKEDIWKRGGAGWMVGKVNVGKSNLFEVVFPKGRNGGATLDKARHEAHKGYISSGNLLESASLVSESTESFSPIDQADANTALSDLPGEIGTDVLESTDESIDPSEPVPEHEQEADDSEVLDDDDDAGPLLPPAQPATAYPVMPIISSLPGTTASPIRIPFGNGKGELIDLPGVARSRLDEHVKEEHKQDLVMRSRVTPEQYTIKPGQSLLLGGLIRITPATPDLIFLAYPFVPLAAHITSTEKAVAMETGEREIGIQTVIEDKAREKVAKAGTFKLEWDVTKKRAGPLTSPTAVKLKAEQLHFTVYSADILIEGVGWVELVAQLRKRRQRPAAALAGPDDGVTFSPFTDTQAPEEESQQSTIPEIDVFSPEGKFIGIRPPMNAWTLGGKKAVPKHLQKSRPRQSMRSLKKSVSGRERQS